MNNVTQVFSFSAGSEAVKDAAEDTDARMGVDTLDTLVASSYQKVGKSLAVVVVVVVKQELWWISQCFGFGNDLVTGVEGVFESWDLLAKKNCNGKYIDNTFFLK